MTAQLKEVVMDTDLFKLEYLLPDIQESSLRFVPWCDELGLWLWPVIGRRKSVQVQLAMCGPR